MKTVFIALALLLLSCLSFAQTFVPDDAFEQKLINLGYDTLPLDDFVPTANIAGITNLVINGDPIVDLTGIEDFAALQVLSIRNTNLTALDMSSNLQLFRLVCNSNNISTININGLTNLDEIVLFDNALTTIDFSTNTALRRFNGGFNPYTQLDFSNNPNMEFVGSPSGSLSSINLTGTSLLEELYLSNNQLSTLDASGKPSLQFLEAETNLLTSIDITGDTSLQFCRISNNSIPTLNVTTNNALSFLSCGNNLLTALDLTNNTALTNLNCRFNQLTTLDLSNNVNLSSFTANNNSLSSINTNGLSALMFFTCNDNQLQSLDMTSNTSLINFYVNNNNLSDLNIQNGNNTAMTNGGFRAQNNPALACILVDDVAYSNTNWTQKDPHTSFSVSCVATTYVPDDAFEQYLITNGYDTGALDNFVPTANINTLTTIDLSTEPIVDFTGIQDFIALTSFTAGNSSTALLDLSQNAALEVIAVGNTTALSDLDLGGLTNLLTVNNVFNDGLINFSVLGATALQSLTATQHFSLSSLDLSTQTNLTFLNVDDGGLTGLDLTNCTSLNTALCGQNQLTTITFGNIPLTSIGLNNNQLTTVDLSQLAGLDFLGISGNQLTALDVSNNPALTHISALDNFLTTMDISNNPILDLLWVDNNQITTITTGTSGIKTLAARNNAITNLDLSLNALLEILYVPDNALTFVNLQNGNNANTSTVEIELQNNPLLTCVEVDDVAYSTTNWTNKDPQTAYSLDCSLGINDTALQSTYLFPNPARESIRISNASEILNYEIMDMQGRRIEGNSLSNDTISIEHLSNGVYFLKLATEIATKTIRFMKGN